MVVPIYEFKRLAIKKQVNLARILPILNLRLESMDPHE